jgi:hypothetical protein
MLRDFGPEVEFEKEVTMSVNLRPNTASSTDIDHTLLTMSDVTHDCLDAALIGI